jgi:creatinine amidohydrolase/Fe(II)-dependent formamide hydrolase-like protein
MKLDMIFPREIENAKKNSTPVVIVGGTVEYHGPQCSYGCDTLIAQGLIEKLSEEKDIINRWAGRPDLVPQGLKSDP